MSIIDKLLEQDDETQQNTQLDGYIDLLFPKHFEEAVLVSRDLMKNHAVIVNISKLEEKQRFLDFVAGTIIAIKGTMKKVSDSVVLYAPESLKVEVKQEQKN